MSEWNVDIDNASIGGDEQTNTVTFTALALTSGVTSGIWNRDTDNVSDGGITYTTTVSGITYISLSHSPPPISWNLDTDDITIGGSSDNNILSNAFADVSLTSSASEVSEWNIDIDNASIGGDEQTDTTVFTSVALTSGLTTSTSYNVDTDDLSYGGAASTTSVQDITNVSLTSSGTWGVVGTVTTFVQVNNEWNSDVEDQISGSDQEIETYFDGTPIELQPYWNRDTDNTTRGGIVDDYMLSNDFTNVNLTAGVSEVSEWNIDTDNASIGGDEQTNTVTFTALALTSGVTSGIWNRDTDNVSDGGVTSTTTVSGITYISLSHSPPPISWNLDTDDITIGGSSDNNILSNAFTDASLTSSASEVSEWNIDIDNASIGGDAQTDTTTFTSVSLTSGVTFGIWNRDTDDVSDGGVVSSTSISDTTNVSLTSSGPWGSIGTDTLFVNIDTPWNTDVDQYTLGSTTDSFITYFEGTPIELQPYWNGDTDITTRGGIVDDDMLSNDFTNVNLTASATEVSEWNIDTDNASIGGDEQTNTVTFTALALTSGVTSGTWSNADTDNVSDGGVTSTTTVSGITYISLSHSPPPISWNLDTDDITIGGSSDNNILSNAFTYVILTSSATEVSEWNIDTDNAATGGDAQTDTTTFTSVSLTSASTSGIWSNADIEDLSHGGTASTTSVQDITNVSLTSSGTWGVVGTVTTLVQVNNEWNSDVEDQISGSDQEIETYFDGTPIELLFHWNRDTDITTRGGIVDDDMLTSFTSVNLTASASEISEWNIDIDNASIGGDAQTDTTTFTSVSLTSGVTSGIWSNVDTDNLYGGGVVSTTSVQDITNISLASSGPWGSVGTDTLFVNVDRPWNTNVDLYTLGSTIDNIMTYFEETPIELPFYWNRDTEITTLGGRIDDDMLTSFTNISLTSGATEVSSWNIDIEDASISGEENTNTTTFTNITLTDGLLSGSWNADTDDLSDGGVVPTTSVSGITNVSLTSSGPWGVVGTVTTLVQVNNEWNSDVEDNVSGSDQETETYFDGTSIELPFHWNRDTDITTLGGIVDDDMLTSFTNVSLPARISLELSRWNVDVEDASTSGNENTNTTAFTAVSLTSGSTTFTSYNVDTDDASDGGVLYTTSASGFTNVSLTSSGPWGVVGTVTNLIQVNNEWNSDVEDQISGSDDEIETYFDGTPIELPFYWNRDTDITTRGGIIDDDMLTIFTHVALTASHQGQNSSWNIDTEDTSIGGDEQTDTTAFTAVSLTSGSTTFTSYNVDTDDASNGGVLYTTSASGFTNVSLTSSGPWGVVGTDYDFVQMDNNWNENSDIHTLGSTTDFMTYFYETPIELPFHWNRDTDITTRGGIIDDDMLSSDFTRVTLATSHQGQNSSWNIDAEDFLVGGSEETNTTAFADITLTSGSTSGAWDNADTDDFSDGGTLSTTSVAGITNISLTSSGPWGIVGTELEFAQEDEAWNDDADSHILGSTTDEFTRYFETTTTPATAADIEHWNSDIDDSSSGGSENTDMTTFTDITLTSSSGTVFVSLSTEVSTEGGEESNIFVLGITNVSLTSSGPWGVVFSDVTLFDIEPEWNEDTMFLLSGSQQSYRSYFTGNMITLGVPSTS
ncbi:beta strand repeat-containing protein [Candidatus Similichlamydia epinepheli]|uniref:beta strand repeat-containing protein n=1 Tax=Candidatus Similichlamydia epinepheli TaxID=1903953 RepID=UPI001300B374|nr:hypothetical protein [Candidatus Similichlamydia epinepheli]